MNLEQRVVLLKKLATYILSDDENWSLIRQNAHHENPWFVPQFIDYQLRHIATEFLQEDKIRHWIARYEIDPDRAKDPKKIGIVMAGNIPLAGFHDFLCVFISGHRQIVKPSSKDTALIKGMIDRLIEWDDGVADLVSLADQLKSCDAYIATGSNNSSRYFEYYFRKYPHIIRRNRSSAAILSGRETNEQLTALAEDVYLYFGLGCRNVTKIYVPLDYDFLPLLNAFKKYDWTADHHKYKNNYDYRLAIMIINKIYYMTNGSILLQENKSLFSPISQLHYAFYTDNNEVQRSLLENADVQCIAGSAAIPFGQAQRPALDDYADKADTMRFLLDLR